MQRSVRSRRAGRRWKRYWGLARNRIAIRRGCRGCDCRQGLVSRKGGHPFGLDQERCGRGWPNCCIEQGDLLSGREFADVGWILRGIAEKKRQPLECADAVERDPVLATVIAFIEDQREGGYSGTATELLKDLLYECERFGFLRRDDRRWPKSGGRLGYRLEVWKPSLEEAGVVHEFHRFSYQRVHTLFSKKFRRG